MPRCQPKHLERWGTSEVMEFEFQVFGELFFIAEYNPSETSIHETILVSGTGSEMT